jgi:hypothetical protein
MPPHRPLRSFCVVMAGVAAQGLGLPLETALRRTDFDSATTSTCSPASVRTRMAPAIGVRARGMQHEVVVLP